MAKRTGSADLPLHGGRVPPWLATRMSSLGAIVTQAIVHHYGRDEFLRRLSHPFWFQSFGAVMGMDWHSSGITTSVIGALKRGLGPLQDELGLHVCGGRGQHSRKTPDELRVLGERIGFDADALTHASRLVAKVDSAAVQDGFDLYLHGFFVTDDGRWTVVQQGMNDDRKQARRYHWHSENLTSFVDEPHCAIDGRARGEVVNLTDRRAAPSRAAQLDLLAALGPDRIVDEFAALTGSLPAQPMLPHLVMPAHHDVRSTDVFTRRLHGTLAAAAERGPLDFPELLLTPGVGGRTVRSLAMVAEVVHGAPYRFRDPARFSLAHGGKDRHPYPVPIKVYDETIRVLKSAVQSAKLGRDETPQTVMACFRLKWPSLKTAVACFAPRNLVAIKLAEAHGWTSSPLERLRPVTESSAMLPPSGAKPMTRTIFNITDLIQARREFIREARALPPGPERNQKRQIALSLKSVIRKSRERHDAFPGGTIH